MVLINDKKYSCATCVKGHRSSSCTHTDRPLFEVKKKGRPISQCEHCRLLRTTKQLHVKCQCLPKSTDSSQPSSSKASSTTSSSLQHTSFSGGNATRMLLDDTRKGVPGAVPTFPNGLRDAHAMKDAADTLTALLSRAPPKSEAGAMRVNTLLNPCRCQAGFQCRCCHGPAQPSVAPVLLRKPSSQSTTPSEGYLSTDDSISQASSLSRAGSSRRPSRISPATHSPASGLPDGYRNILPGPPPPRHLDDALQGISPQYRSHPAHVDPHVHKTQLFSPYRTSSSSSRQSQGHKEGGLSRNPSSRRSRISSSSATSSRRQSESEHRYYDTEAHNLELPVLRSITASNAQVPLPSITFPLTEGLQMQGCTCSDDCACPGCAVHTVPKSDFVIMPETSGSSSSTSSHCGTPTRSNPCPESCNSCFDCSRKFEAPMETESILELMSLAAAAMPHPHAGTMPVDMGSTLAADPINLMNASGPVRSMNMANGYDGYGIQDHGRPAAVSQNSHDSWSSASISGCCDGRCQCPPGDCACVDDCCGCCITCPCASQAEVEDRSTPGPSGGCCSSRRNEDVVQPPMAVPTRSPDIKEEDPDGDDDEDDLTMDRFDTIQPDSGGDGGRARFDEALLTAENAFSNDPTAWAEAVANGGFYEGVGSVGIQPGVNFWDPTGPSGSYPGSEVGEDYPLPEEVEEEPFADTLEAQLEALGLPWVLSEGEMSDEPTSVPLDRHGHRP